MKNPNKQTGAAVIVALFLVALVTAMAVAMLDRLRVDTRRTELLLNAAQGLSYVKGSVVWAKDQLNQNWKNKRDNQLVDRTPINTKNVINNATVINSITDTQGLFNLNNLNNTESQADFARLITTVYPKLNQDGAKKIVLAIADWISQGVKGSAYDRYYSEQHPAYIAPHRLMGSVSELRLVQGITPELYNLLAPYVTALPANGTQININSAEAPVIMSLSKTMTLESAKGIVAYRQKTPFTTVQQFTGFEIVKNNPIPENKITVTSSYFLVQSEVTIGQQTTKLTTLLERKTKDIDAKTGVIWQTQGTL